MKVEYAIVAAVVGAVYLVVLNWFPDFPVDGVVFQTIILWALAKIGVEVSVKPANKIRSLTGK